MTDNALEPVRSIQQYAPQTIDGVVSIMEGSLYVKKPEALPVLLEHLAAFGYNMRDTSAEADSSRPKPPRSVQEKNGWGLWHGKLDEKVLSHKGECDSCHQFIDTTGIHAHAHTCEHCGDYTYIRYRNGGQMRFGIDDERERIFDDLTLIIHSYDAQKKRLLFYADPAEYRGKDLPVRESIFTRTLTASYEELPRLIAQYPATFSHDEVDGDRVIAVPHDVSTLERALHGINPKEVTGEAENYSMVRLFLGEKVKGLARLPIPEFISIYEAWHWAPLGPGPETYKKIMSAASMVSRKDYYYQDGRPAFNKEIINRMYRFVEAFTTFDANEVFAHAHRHLSGPDFIDALAQATGNSEFIPTAPNIGNALELYAKLDALAHGENVGLSTGEIVEGLKSIDADDFGPGILRTIHETRQDLPKRAKPHTKNITPRRLIDE
jgi:hypothetical protein